MLSPCREKTIKGVPKHCKLLRWAPEHPFMSTLLGPKDPETLKLLNKSTGESVQSHPKYSAADSKMNAWGSCTKNSPSVWPGLAYRVKPAWLGPLQEAWDAPTAILPMGLSSLSWTSGVESAKWLREDTPEAWLGSSRDIPIIEEGMGQSGIRAPPLNSQASTSHPPQPPQSCPANEQLSHFMEDLNLQLRPHVSRSRAQWGDVPTSTVEKPRKKQVRLDVDKELGNNPTLPQDLTLFLVEGVGKEQDDTPSPFIPMPDDSPWPLLSEGPQWHHIYTGGTRPKVPPKPSAHQSQSQPKPRPKEKPDMCNHPHKWIHMEMEKTLCPHWWKEIKATRKVSMGSHIVREGLSNFEALHWAWWQAVAFRLPLAKHEALGWWDAPLQLSRHHPKDFMLLTDASHSRDFRAVREEKTLALAQRLQACTEGLGVPTGILCDTVWELQKCMAPLMTLSGNDIIEAPSWNPMKKCVEPSPLQRRKQSSWVRNPRPHPSWIPRDLWTIKAFRADWHLVYQIHQVNWCSSLPCSPIQLPLLLEGKESLERDWDWPKPCRWMGPLLPAEKMKEYWNGGGSSDFFSAPRRSALAMSKSKGWPIVKLWPSGCQPHSWKKLTCGLSHPALVCLGERTSFPQRSSREFKIIKWCGVKKWLYWPWPSRGVLFILECHQSCSAEQYKSSTAASLPYLRGEIY